MIIRKEPVDGYEVRLVDRANDGYEITVSLPERRNAKIFFKTIDGAEAREEFEEMCRLVKELA